MKATELAAVMRGIAPVIRDVVARGLLDLSVRIKALEDRPPPERGPQGERGEKGERGEIGPEGPQGIPGRDGSPGVPGRDGERGPMGEKGLDGSHGKDGRDGAIEGTYTVLEDDGHTVTWRYKDTHLPVPDWSVTFPNLVYREVFAEGTTYVRGDAVTWGGAIYVARARRKRRDAGATGATGEGRPELDLTGGRRRRC
jgi:integrin beta 3